MNFQNPGFVGQPRSLINPFFNPNLKPNLGSGNRQVQPNLPLNTPMISRIHNAKPGCSACGKKVA